MPQPRKSSGSTRSSPRPRRAAPPESESGLVGQGVEALRDTLARAADSLNLVLLSRERLQSAVDDAVSRGHMTREAANGLVSELVRRGRREIEDVLADTDQLVGRVKGTPGADLALQQVDRARRAVGVGPSFPILNYEDLTAAQVGERLDALTPAQLRKVRDHERRHGNRKSVLTTLEKRLNA